MFMGEYPVWLEATWHRHGRTNPFHKTMPMVYPKYFLFALKCRYVCRVIKRNCGLRKMTISRWAIFIMPVTTPGFSFFFFFSFVCYTCNLWVPVILWLASSVLWGLWEPAARKIYLCCWGFVFWFLSCVHVNLYNAEQTHCFVSFP